MSGMDLKEQKYVCTLAECGTLVQAAEKLFITQPALSLYITNLEKTLGLPLFERRGKKFKLTYTGRCYVEKARKMLALQREFNEEIEEIAREQRGLIRLGIAQRRGSWLLSPVLAEYDGLWPEIEIRLREGNLSVLYEMLRNAELDLVVLNDYDATDRMEKIVLFEEEFLVAVSPEHPINAKSFQKPGEYYRRVHPEDMNGECLLLCTKMQSTRKIEDQIIQSYKLCPAKIREFRSVETAVQMAAEGMGISFVREGFAVNLHYDKPLCYYIPDIPDHKKTVVAAYTKNSALPKYMRDFIYLLKEHAAHYCERRRGESPF